MGQEVSTDHYKKHDFRQFEHRLREETELLLSQLAEGALDTEERVVGFELESWLVDKKLRPLPENAEFISRTTEVPVSPELADYNVELNSEPQCLRAGAFRKLHDELDRTWSICRRHAAELGGGICMIGVLPTAREQDLTLAHMSRMTRYRALNQEVLRLREGAPLCLDIVGKEHLRTSYHQDVMLESATTSLQVHLQVPAREAARYFNVSQILAAPLVAAAANSPFLFEKDLWDETRIPLFEQAVDVGGGESAHKRVTFGSGYARNCLGEYFTENLERYPVLLPIFLEEPLEMFPHLRLHNGTIWRWNRPLIGFDAVGSPHVRIEHRVMASGPTAADVIANVAFYAGLAHALVGEETPLESEISFDIARRNFYAASKDGLRAKLVWSGGAQIPVQSLLLEVLLPKARHGLEILDFSRDEIDDYLGVIEARVHSKRNGAAWQRAFVAKHGPDFVALTAAYLERQHSGKPVSDWSL